MINESELLGFWRRIVNGDEVARFVYADWLEENGREEEAKKQRKIAGFVRRVEIAPAFDRVAVGEGIHGAEIRMVLIGPEGAIQFLCYTNWHLPSARDRLLRGLSVADNLHAAVGALFTPTGADVGYHAKRPQYIGQVVGETKCPYTGGVCYYDGSGMQGASMMNLLISQGSEVVWKSLEERYHSQFEGGR